LAKRGAVCVIVDLDKVVAESAAARLSGSALGLAADVGDRGAMQRMIATVTEQRGAVDVVLAIKRRGGTASRDGPRNEQRNFDRVLAVNLGGVYNTVRTAVPQLPPVADTSF
jgi:NAD(P)-dependent dehydrogenase (short-subunit alcohol dehydrogenase family)